MNIWTGPGIEAIVYGEEAAPRDVMQPRVTDDGVLIQGFFPGTEAAEVIVGKKSYPMTLEDEAGILCGYASSEKNSGVSFSGYTGQHERGFF